MSSDRRVKLKRNIDSLYEIAELLHGSPKHQCVLIEDNKKSLKSYVGQKNTRVQNKIDENFRQLERDLSERFEQIESRLDQVEHQISVLDSFIAEISD